MRILLHGGKTAPRLLQDLSVYNPSNVTSTAFNTLTSIPFHDEDLDNVPARPPRSHCKHQWSIKNNQSTIPDNGARPDTSTVWLVGAYCSTCRCHLELLMDFRDGDYSAQPCPTGDRPLHHFVYQSEISKPRQHSVGIPDSESGFTWIDEQCFRCSFLPCSAKLAIRLKSPRLIPVWVNQLVTKSVIKTRAERAMASDPERFEGHGVPLPINVLVNLRLYIQNAVDEPDKSRRIFGHNKKFMLSLGESCADLLEYIGFVREGDDWLPPKPQTSSASSLSDTVNARLEDIAKELSVLISERPDDERRTISHQYAPELAAKKLTAALGCLDYKQSVRSRTVDLTADTQEHPFYAGLGASEDFHDDLLVFCYKCQLEVDNRNTPYYLECLQGIAEGRRSEDLQTQAAIEASAGNISIKDVKGAFRELGLDSRTTYDDDTIIGTFQSRVSDAPKQEAEMRRALQIIGQSRSSQRIELAASQAVSNYDQALLYLSTSADIADEFVVTMYTLKVTEKPSEESIARHAVSLIASHRKSKALKQFLDTGALGEVEMDVGQAYVRLGISDRTLDDDTILSAYNVRLEDTPSQIEDLKSALSAIAKSKNSRRIKDFIDSGMISSDHSLSDWPVGLENIGNTCYLNSLLQFYFTIKPLRDLVLNIDEFKMSTEEDRLSSKRVGSRNVSKKEVARAQQFVDELRKLFQCMISSSKASVTPEPELARLTLVSSSKEEHLRRQSILSSLRPSLGDITGSPIIGPIGPPGPLSIEQQDTEMGESEALDTASAKVAKADLDGDTASDITLVDDQAVEDVDDDVMILDGVEKGIQEKILENKENIPPTKPLYRESSPEAQLMPLGEASSSRVNEQLGSMPSVAEAEGDSTSTAAANQMPLKDIEDEVDTNEISTAMAPPSRPPPVPPRPKPTESNAVQEAEYGAQQDVTEVIANVLFQLQCAIKAESVDDSGEQIDQVKRLFFGKQKSYTTNNQGTIRTKEEYMSDIKVDVASGSRDIYAALDGAYDVQDVEVGGYLEPQYTSISQLPPILQIMVQRVQFDPEKRSVFKSNHHLELKETIYLDRYMDSSDADLLQRRRECWEWKKQLLIMEKRMAQLVNSEIGMDMPEILEATHGYLCQLADIDDDKDRIEVSSMLIQAMRTAAIEAKKELETLDSRIKDLKSNVASQFNDLREIPYRLQSVFIHRGYHNSGHYWIYIYDFSKHLWRKYNDGYVTEVKDTNVIFQQEPGDRPATPYFLVYVRDESKEDLVDSVCRDVVEPPPEERVDTPMEECFQATEGHSEASTYRPIDSSMDHETTGSYEWPQDPTWDRVWNASEASTYTQW